MTRTKHVIKVIELRRGEGKCPHRDGLGNGWTNGDKNIFIEVTK